MYKKPNYKRWWFILIAIFIVIGAIGLFGEDEPKKVETSSPVSETNEDNNTKDEDKTEDKVKEKVEEPKEKVTGVGTPLEVGDAIFTLNGLELADQVGPTLLPEKASGKYVVIDVTYKNNGNDAVTIDASFFKLVRGEKTYESDSIASMSANQGEDGGIDNSFFFQEVNPDMEISGKVVFDLAPEVATATDLQLQVQTGIFGTETGIINLK